MKFKIGDYVKAITEKVKQNDEYEDEYGAFVHGKVTKIRHADNDVEVQLDGPSLALIPDDIILGSWDEGIDIYHYVFSAEDLEPAQKREADAELKTQA